MMLFGLDHREMRGEKNREIASLGPRGAWFPGGETPTREKREGFQTMGFRLVG